MDDKEKRSRLKRKKLYLLSTTMSGVDKSGKKWSQTIYAIDIDANYPWVGGFTDKKEGAGAFTSSFLRAMKSSNASLVKAGFLNTSYEVSPAPKDHAGMISCLTHELKD